MSKPTSKTEYVLAQAQAAGPSSQPRVGNWTEMSALDYIATRIAPKFGGSAEVIAKRLRVEKLWPPNERESQP